MEEQDNNSSVSVDSQAPHNDVDVNIDGNGNDDGDDDGDGNVDDNGNVDGNGNVDAVAVDVAVHDNVKVEVKVEVDPLADIRDGAVAECTLVGYINDNLAFLKWCLNTTGGLYNCLTEYGWLSIAPLQNPQTNESRCALNTCIHGAFKALLCNAHTKIQFVLLTRSHLKSTRNTY